MSTGVPGFFGLKAESNFPPVISSVTLTESSPGDGTLFGNQSFSVDVVMTNEGKPVAGKALKGYIDGTFNEPVLTDFISSVQEGGFLQGFTFYAVDASETAFDGGVGSPTTSNFVSVAAFQEVSSYRQDHFLAVTDDNKLAYSPNGVQWEVSDAGIPNAVFRKVQPLYSAGQLSPSGPPVFVACGQISGGNYFLATCDDNATFEVDKYLAEEILFLSANRNSGGSWAGTTTELYYRRDLQTEWQLIDSGNGPYQYQDGEPGSQGQYVRNGNFVINTPRGAYTALTGLTLTGGFDDLYAISSSVGSSAYGLAGSGGTIFVDTGAYGADISGRFNYSSTAITGATNYYRPRVPDSNPWWNVIITYVTISGGVITARYTSQIDNFIFYIDNNATLTDARDVAYSDTNKLGVFVGNGGEIIFAVHETSAVTFSSDLNFSLINEYDTLNLVIGNTEYPEYRFFVLDKSSSSMTLLGESVLSSSGDRRLRGGSLTTSAARRYLQMINYAGAYNNVESLVASDPGFTDQQTTGNEIPEIRFPATYADQSGFINRFEDVVEPGATFTVELQASNPSGSDTDSDTVTPS